MTDRAKFVTDKHLFNPNECFACNKPIHMKGDPAVPLALRDKKGRSCWVHLDCVLQARAILEATDKE